MPSQPFDTGWDFGPVLDLIDSDIPSIGSPTLIPASQAVIQKHENKTKTKNNFTNHSNGVGLGNFAKLFEELGISDDEAPPLLSSAGPESDELTSDDALLPPLIIDEQDVNSSTNHGGLEPYGKEIEWPITKDLYTRMTKKQQRQTRKGTEKMQKAEKQREKEFKQREGVQKDPQTLADSPVPNTSAPNHSIETSPKQLRKELAELFAPDISPNDRSVEPTTVRKQVRARSNVGAKIRPTTPVELDASDPAEQKTVDSPATVGTVTAPTSALHSSNSIVPPAQQLNTHAQPFMSGSAEHPLVPVHSSQHNRLSPAVTELSSALAAQYATFGTTLHSQHSLAPAMLSQFQSNVYYHSQLATPPGHGHGLIPRNFQHVNIQRPVLSASALRPVQAPMTPIQQPPFKTVPTIRSQEERHFHFLHKLMHDFPENRKYLVSPKRLCNEKISGEGIHVFVDASNIMIGFKDLLREYGLDAYDMSFDSLALLMERRRPVAKRVFAGSHREANPLPHVTKLVETSKAVGYENNVKEQVFIRREDTEKKKFFKDVKKLGWTKAAQRRSGSGSDSDMGPVVPATPSAPKWVEQGVDEILHLKMCQSIIDTENPTTMVLATGDGAEAEHSDGFLAHVERALKKGWKVELVSWRQQTSGGYKNRRFRATWGDSFRIIELDDYLESLIDTP